MKLRNILLAIFSLSMMIIVLSSPDKYLNSCLDGLILWATRLVPTLIPFCFLTSILSHSGLPYLLSQKVGGIFAKLYGCSKLGAYVYLLSIISGYPVGADTLRDLHSRGDISTRDVEIISSFASTSGPIFVIGTVGVGMFASIEVGVIMYLIHILSALLNGLLYRRKYLPSTPTLLTKDEDILAIATSSTLKSTLLVGVLVTIFYLIADVLVSIGVIGAISSILPIPDQISYSILTGVVEMTRGCLAISEVGSPLSIPIASALISLGGGCILSQSMTMLKDSGVSSIKIMIRKVSQALITFCISVVVFTYFI